MLDADYSRRGRLIKAAGGSMVERGAGSTVSVASIAGLVGEWHFAAQMATTHVLVGLAGAVSLDRAPRNVLGDALRAGTVRDAHRVVGRMLAKVARPLGFPAEKYEDKFVPSEPTGTLLELEAVSVAAPWSYASRWVTGGVRRMDGGTSARVNRCPVPTKTLESTS